MRKPGMHAPDSPSASYKYRFQGSIRPFSDRRTLTFPWAVIMVGLMVGASSAQEAAVRDEQINQIRTIASIGPGDQGRIRQWVEAEITSLTGADEIDYAAVKRFLDRVEAQLNNQRNTEAFTTQFITQTTQMATEWMRKEDAPAKVKDALALVLVRLRRPEVADSLIAGLASNSAATRTLCAKGLTEIRSLVAEDNARLQRTIEALQAAGVKETSPVAMAYIYLALAFPNRVGQVFDVFMALFDYRLDVRRSTSVVVDRAEVEAFEYFRQPAVQTALTAEQKNGLVRRLAVFLRLDAERYQATGLTFDERVVLERRLDANESILSAVAGGGGDVRGELAQRGFDGREGVLQQAYRWTGNPETNEAGALNTAPWDVPVGAP